MNSGPINLITALPKEPHVRVCWRIVDCLGASPCDIREISLLALVVLWRLGHMNEAPPQIPVARATLSILSHSLMPYATRKQFMRCAEIARVAEATFERFRRHYKTNVVRDADGCVFVDRPPRPVQPPRIITSLTFVLCDKHRCIPVVGCLPAIHAASISFLYHDSQRLMRLGRTSLAYDTKLVVSLRNLASKNCYQFPPLMCAWTLAFVKAAKLHVAVFQRSIAELLACRERALSVLILLARCVDYFQEAFLHRPKDELSPALMSLLCCTAIIMRAWTRSPDVDLRWMRCKLWRTRDIIKQVLHSKTQ